ncbi:hypothetical protein CsSME_00046652 [Camellia sinensis var. sinensis]
MRLPYKNSPHRIITPPPPPFTSTFPPSNSNHQSFS